MIEYQQVGDGTPKDVAVITDDSNAEMIKIQEMVEEAGLEETVFWANFKRTTSRSDDGKFHFVIPGDEVGEIADYMDVIDNGALDMKLADWNEALIEAAEAGPSESE